MTAQNASGMPSLGNSSHFCRLGDVCKGSNYEPFIAFWTVEPEGPIGPEREIDIAHDCLKWKTRDNETQTIRQSHNCLALQAVYVGVETEMDREKITPQISK